MTRLSTAWTPSATPAGSTPADHELVDQDTPGRLEERSRAPLAVDQGHQFRTLEQRAPQRGCQRGDANGRVPAPDRYLTQSSDDPFGDTVEQRLLVSHMPVDGRCRHTQFGGQSADGQAVDPLGFDDQQSRVEHLIAGEPGARRPSGICLTSPDRHVTMLQARRPVVGMDRRPAIRCRNGTWVSASNRGRRDDER